MYVRGCPRARGRVGRNNGSASATVHGSRTGGDGDGASSVATGAVSPTMSEASSVGTLASRVESLSMATDENAPVTMKLPQTRPPGLQNKQGTVGKQVQLISNYIKILSAPQWDLYRYHCTMDPPIELRKHRREILSQAGIKDVAFDGVILFAFDDMGNEKVVTTDNPEKKDEKVKITMKRIASVSPQSPEFFHLANLIVRKLIEIAGLKLIGRNYYAFDKKIELNQHNLTLFPGFLTAVNVYEGQLMINIDLSTKVLNKTTVYTVFRNIFERNPGAQGQELVIKELVGQIVMTMYNHETYRIMDIAWDKSPNEELSFRDGTKKTLAQYYRDKYQVKIEDLDQPLILVKPSKRFAKREKSEDGPVFLIPELCCVTGITDAMRSNFTLMKEMAQYTHVGPAERYQTLKGFVDQVQMKDEGKREIKKWRIDLDSDLVHLTGRQMDAEEIMYKDGIVRYSPEQADWSTGGRSKQHLVAKNLETWLLIYTRNDAETANTLVDALYKVCTPFGMKVEYPRQIELPHDRADAFVKAINDNRHDAMDLVCCILPNNRKDRYDAIKKVLCCDYPVPSQMIVSKTLKRQGQVLSVATKVGIQINAKLGGEIWGVQIPSKTLMIVGIDTYRDQKVKSTQMVGFVATINPTCTRYYSRVIEQKSGANAVAGLKQCMEDALRQYQKMNSTLPDRIIIYRDGVNDMQLFDVVDGELPALNDCCQKFMEGYVPKLAVVVVKKRGAAKFFMSTGQGRLGNPLPGTVVDHTVTNEEWYDFYLISQCARQGTVAPTHYNVVWDRTGLKPDQLQRITHKLAHLYYNWPGTIRVPGVCQYAYKLAFLVANSLHSQPSEQLATKLFYL